MSVYSALQLLKYTHAVVCRIPTSLGTKSKINIEEARKQHEAFVKLLRELYLDVIELPADESLPECGFVEDTAIVCNGIALMTKPDSAVRQKEVIRYDLGVGCFCNLFQFTVARSLIINS